MFWILLAHIVAVLIIAYIGLALTLYYMQPSLLYRPLRDVLYTPEDLGIDFEKVLLKTTDGINLSAWYIPAKDAKLTILFCHGNGGNMMHRLDTINIFYNLGLNCFIFDYRGYGESEGKPTEEGTYRDAWAAFKWLTKEKNISAENIIIFGRSLGGSVAARLASKTRVRSLVVESTFTSYTDMGSITYPYLPVRWFARFKYNTLARLRKVRCPVLLVHSRNDEIVPFEFGLELYETANEPKEFVEIYGSHNDGFLVSGDIYKNAWKKWIKFLTEHKQQTTGQQSIIG